MRKLGLFLMVVVQSACVSAGKVLERPVGELPPNLAIETHLNATFSNQPLKEDYRIADPLHLILLESLANGNFKRPADLSGRLRLRWQEEGQLEAEYWQGDTLVASKILKGMLKENRFILRRRMRVIGFPLVIFAYYERRIILEINEAQNLVVRVGDQSFGNAFLFFAGNFDKHIHEYPRLNY